MKVLESTQTTGREFNLPGGVQRVIVDSHPGGNPAATVVLQERGPNQWVNIADMAFTANGVKSFHSAVGGRYRIQASAAGSEVEVSGAY